MPGDKTHYMTKEDAIRIQLHADKNQTNQDFKARVQGVVDRRENTQSSGGSAFNSGDKK